MIKLRDRDAPVTREGIIMRVYGYDHPKGWYICDAEYAPETIYKSSVPRALRDGGRQRYYKFYEDEGLRFVLLNYPQYSLYLPQLKRRVVAISEEHAVEVRTPQEGLVNLLGKEDAMSQAALELLEIVLKHSKLGIQDFGVFGSLLHEFYRAEFSDLDFVVYGINELAELREALNELYKSGLLRNEFDNIAFSSFDIWPFRNYDVKEYVWHQRRKSIYGVLSSRTLRRSLKFEFEPVLKWSEITNEFDDLVEVKDLGFIEAVVRVVDDKFAHFMPSKYEIEVVEVRKAPPVKVEARRVLSFVEEFRMQLFKDEVGLVMGWLEEVETRSSTFQQIVLTRRERYYDQVLKRLEPQ